MAGPLCGQAGLILWASASVAQDCGADAFQRAICALPAQQREAVLLYYYQDMTLTEIAQVLEVAPSTVKRRLDSAHKALQRKLEGG